MRRSGVGPDDFCGLQRLHYHIASTQCAGTSIHLLIASVTFSAPTNPAPALLMVPARSMAFIMLRF
eukprot:8570289-Pyramimonas_sp.AAC.1